jgi:hypothetical protein
MFGRPTPRSKRDPTIPYTFEAHVDALRGQGSEPIDQSYFSDTICGLVRVMIDEGIKPSEVRLYGVYRKELIPLEVERCVGDAGGWITPPQLCHELEAYYHETMDERYRGHVEDGECMYEDRDQTGIGPY